MWDHWILLLNIYNISQSSPHIPSAGKKNTSSEENLWPLCCPKLCKTQMMWTINIWPVRTSRCMYPSLILHVKSESSSSGTYCAFKHCSLIRACACGLRGVWIWREHWKEGLCLFELKMLHSWCFVSGNW